MNLQQHAKNQAFSSFCSSDKVNLKILQSDCLRAFWPRSQEPNFSQVWDLSQNTANNINFFLDQIQIKVMTKFSNKFKKTLILAHFWVIFPILGANFFSKNSALSRTTTHGPLITWVSEKTNEPIPRKLPDGRMVGQTNRPYFIGPFWPQP